MATSHFCNGKWRPGPVAACPKHKKLSKKQPSVYRSSDDAKASSDGSGSSPEPSPSGGS